MTNLRFQAHFCCRQILLLSLLLALESAKSTCLSPPTNLVSWWSAEGNANDVAGTNNGSFIGAIYDIGEVGFAFSFNGGSNNVIIPASATLDVGSGGGLTVEAWIKTTDTSTGRPIIEWAPNGNYGVHFWVHAFGAGVLYADLFGTDGASHILQSPSGVVTNNVFQHVALTYDKASGIGRLYGNGVLVTEVNLGSFTPVTSPDLYIGYRPSFVPYGPIPFKGLIDETSVYSRALSASEIVAIYNAGAAGKCGPPQAPAISAQPTNQTVFVGQTVSFAVGAYGTAPLTYQWSFNGSPIESATNSSLSLASIQSSQAGGYSVQITNAIGSTNSITAVLTVNLPPPCVTPPAGLVGWWPGSGDASDIAGPDNGIFIGPAFDNGEVGEAFNFNTGTNYVRVPASPAIDLGKASGFTVEAWIRSTDASTGRPIVEWAPNGNYGVHFWVNAFGAGVLYADVFDASGVSHILQSAAGVVTNNVFQHVALTYDKASGVGSLFANGVLVKQSSLGSFTPMTSADLYFGYRPSFVPFGPLPFEGLIDEVSLYSRALGASELQAIYGAGFSGKCIVAFPAAIDSEPADETVTVGQTATFGVGAIGTQPLSYQWSYNGTAIAGATNATLVLTNVQRVQAGSYAVVVTNSLNAVTSSNANLTVNFPPAQIVAGSSSADPLGNVVVPVTLVANGNENALGFSLAFSPTLLTYVGATLGSGATNATLVINSNQIASGYVGLALSLSTGTSFAPGTQEVAEIEFTAAVLSNTALAHVNFGDQPTRRELSDPQANPLTATYTSATVTIPAANLEGDVSPRPNGDKAVTITDWVLVGRYAARLDYPTNGSEYQRADCAPRSTLGDGAITVADWVQAGRYAAGLDPATRAGGPTNDLGPNVVKLTSNTKPAPKGLSRALRVANVDLVQTQPGAVSVYLDAQGDENALGFSLSFDPATLSFMSTSLGSGAAGATIDVNTNQVGVAAVVLALPVGSTFAAGTQEILKVSMAPVATAAGFYTVALGDQPVVRQVVDANATPLVTTYMNGSITVNPPPSLTATRLQQNISLSWPIWATNFNLQEADGTTFPSLVWSNVTSVFNVTNNAAEVVLPITGATRFYRLQR